MKASQSASFGSAPVDGAAAEHIIPRRGSDGVALGQQSHKDNTTTSSGKGLISRVLDRSVLSFDGSSSMRARQNLSLEDFAVWRRASAHSGSRSPPPPPEQSSAAASPQTGRSASGARNPTGDSQHRGGNMSSSRASLHKPSPLVTQSRSGGGGLPGEPPLPVLSDQLCPTTASLLLSSGAVSTASSSPSLQSPSAATAASSPTVAHAAGNNNSSNTNAGPALPLIARTRRGSGKRKTQAGGKGKRSASSPTTTGSAATEPAAAAPRGQDDKAVILVVEDNTINAKVL